MIGVQTFGGKELSQALGQLSTRVSRNVQREALRDAAEPLRKEMSVRAPRRPPHPDMADHIVVVSVRGEDLQQVVIAVGPAKRFFYAGFQELGTAFHGAQAFARPAFDATVGTVLAAFGANLWVALSGRGIRRQTEVAEGPVSGPGRLV